MRFQKALESKQIHYIFSKDEFMGTQNLLSNTLSCQTVIHGHTEVFWLEVSALYVDWQESYPS